eukprot:gnl/MRDRNA2_/MRDRNA2_99307_c0_seq1.p1 gnl/MRDRNA2_/MRDRNA2_99307_c0~~gnl/MRDRNA2_/MRDRNA2_99307_c0_seq1.p1  ORF type:complete len:308 (+),score=85.33 gnl/MRDRNA2_/MRDRNA2_99307_c0_seq1:114-1037(+)
MLLKIVTLASLVIGATSNAPAGGEVVQPKMVIPGEWMVDAKETFMFLPLTVPTGMPADQIKIMSNGDSILVVVTEKPQEQPETNAIKKYKLVVDALKQEAGHDEKVLKDKLQEWYETEDDDEVKVQVKSALDSLTQVRQAKANTAIRTVSVPLGMLAKQAATAMLGKDVAVQGVSFLAKASLHNTTKEPEEVEEAEHVLSALHTDKKIHTGIIKESFAVEIPYPVDTEKVFILKQDASANELMVAMPLHRNSLAAQGISTGGKPFLRVPVFSVTGQVLAGPSASLNNLAGDLHVPSVIAKTGLKPLP